MAAARLPATAPHLPGCDNAANPVPCYLDRGECHATHVLGLPFEVNGAPVSVLLARTLHGTAGADAYVNVGFDEAGGECNLSVSPDQARQLAALLVAAADLADAQRADDVRLEVS